MTEVNCLTIGCNQKHGHLGPHGDVQTIRRDLGSYNSGPVGRQNEEWSAREVRPLNQSDHRFCGVSEEALRAMYAVNIPTAVTLEGLAAVIGSLSEALHALGGDRDENKQTIAALVKAAEAVTALLTTEVRASDELTAAKKALSALTDPKGHIWHGDGGECTGECKDIRKVLGIKEHIEDHQQQRADWTERHAAHAAADIAAREASGQAEENRKARAESLADHFAAKTKEEQERLGAAYNRAIADAHAAVGDALGEESPSHSIQAQVAIRKLYRKVS
jgi:hypothetical protein